MPLPMQQMRRYTIPTIILRCSSFTEILTWVSLRQSIPEIFANVPSEGEGIRLVKKSLAYLVKTGHIWLIPQLVIQSGAKYAGYFLGKRYWKLPHRLVMACTMSPWYWKQK